eukprot:s3827_g3.t1
MGDLLRPAPTWIAQSSRSRKRPSSDDQAWWRYLERDAMNIHGSHTQSTRCFSPWRMGQEVALAMKWAVLLVVCEVLHAYRPELPPPQLTVEDPPCRQVDVEELCRAVARWIAQGWCNCRGYWWT